MSDAFIVANVLAFVLIALIAIFLELRNIGQILGRAALRRELDGERGAAAGPMGPTPFEDHQLLTALVAQGRDSAERGSARAVKAGKAKWTSDEKRGHALSYVEQQLKILGRPFNADAARTLLHTMVG